LDKIRDITGVCPQHDILWNELTAREHLRIFAEMKGIPNNKIKEMIEEKLKQVFLTDVGNKQSGTFSGGMKRRLSVAISTIGDPKIIFLDEPTTGMDPGNRRHVWNMIEKIKKGRIIILTTHSMEEADVLGDRVAIMVSGKLKCIGTALHLKNKFGSGYRIRIVTPVSSVDKTKEFVLSHLPHGKLEDAAAGSLTFSLPPEFNGEIPNFFAQVEKEEGNLIHDWGISQTTLEDVFLRLTRINMNPVVIGQMVTAPVLTQYNTAQPYAGNLIASPTNFAQPPLQNFTTIAQSNNGPPAYTSIELQEKK